MEDIKARELRKKLDNKLIKLVAPAGMSIAEYKINCNLEGFEPSVENGMFLHWVMTAGGDDANLVEKVDKAILNAIIKKYLLDTSNEEQCSYFCDAVRDLVLKDKDYATDLLEAVFKNYKDSSGYGPDVFDFCKRLNKCLGLTAIEYFSHEVLSYA